MCNHNCTAWEGKHTRLGCKIAALLASAGHPSSSLMPRRAGAAFVCLAGQTFERPVPLPPNDERSLALVEPRHAAPTPGGS